MKKRTSKRRWKARIRLGRAIPAFAMIEHELRRWFVMVPERSNRDFWLWIGR
jgi:hypothetical protein